MEPIVLFDGECWLCNASVALIVRNDPVGRYRFARLGSPAAFEILNRVNCDEPLPDAVLLWEEGRLYTASTAALRIARRLRFPWPLLYAFILVPRPLRDAVYAWIARRRRAWLGARDACRLPTPEERSRFLG
ncbi:MAG: DCC1-like thiol-disulfide oxidoreductase family protein [Anaerolineae bacterium]